MEEEFVALLEADGADEVVAAAKALNRVLLVASAEAPKSREDLGFSAFEETRSLRAEVVVSEPFFHSDLIRTNTIVGLEGAGCGLLSSLERDIGPFKGLKLSSSLSCSYSRLEG